MFVVAAPVTRVVLHNDARRRMSEWAAEDDQLPTQALKLDGASVIELAAEDDQLPTQAPKPHPASFSSMHSGSLILYRGSTRAARRHSPHIELRVPEE